MLLGWISSASLPPSSTLIAIVTALWNVIVQLSHTVFDMVSDMIAKS